MVWKWNIALLFLCEIIVAEQLSFDSESSWRSWEMPSDLILFDEGGTLSLRRINKEINAAANAHQFQHVSQERDQVRGGIWLAKTNSQTASKIIDGDPETFWQPDQNDALDQWSVQVDLGRPVLARQIRLRFPNRKGARPLRQFSVFVSSGSRTDALKDVFKFEAVYRTFKPNTSNEVVIPLEYIGIDSTYVIDAQLDIDIEHEKLYRVIQYLIIEIDEKSTDAALAEIEVLAVGDNVSLGTAGRGGGFLEGGRTTGAALMFDGNMDTFALLTSADGGWLDAGVWWRIDLGAVFFLDEIFIYQSQLGEGLRGQAQGGNPSAAGGNFLISDGRPASNSSLPVPERVDYDVLIEDRCRPQCAGQIFRQRYMFTPRKVRYLLWHEIDELGGGTGWGLETMLFAEGYPAQVQMRSDFIDLAATNGDGRPRVIKQLEWSAHTPPGTKIQLRSRSGKSLRKVYTFYDRKGDAITEKKWNSAPKVLRGRVDTSLVTGDDWDNWSNVYQFSGEIFKSKSPRRYLQLELILSSDDPQETAELHSVSVEFEEAIFQQVRGEIWPRRANPNEMTAFTYTLWTEGDLFDSGFDVLRLAVPGEIGGEISVHLGEKEVPFAEVIDTSDSLYFFFPERVKADTVKIQFGARLLEYAALFSVDVGVTDRPGIWQPVEPIARRANIVTLPDLPGQGQLVGDLKVRPPVLSPNGDGINERAQISFVVFKATERVPDVTIRDLDGQDVVVLTAERRGIDELFFWDGRDAHGTLVGPGIYICDIDLGTKDSGGRVLRTIGVTY
ncbi:MAG: discoidin domain-containing protein [Candidatus Latescibacterota bacterium]|nr:discoidin domain-containing protein [Candidatus Latescibacterota bacterium]